VSEKKNARVSPSPQSIGPGSKVDSKSPRPGPSASPTQESKESKERRGSREQREAESKEKRASRFKELEEEVEDSKLKRPRRASARHTRSPNPS
jgi:hypothetical protein